MTENNLSYDTITKENQDHCPEELREGITACSPNPVPVETRVVDGFDDGVIMDNCFMSAALSQGDEGGFLAILRLDVPLGNKRHNGNRHGHLETANDVSCKGKMDVE